MIEAKEAKQIAWRKTHQHIISQYHVIDKLIHDAAEEGSTLLEYPCELYPEVREALMDYGYQIKQYTEQYSSIKRTIISWE